MPDGQPGYATFYVEKPDVNAELDAVKSGEADIALGDITVSAQRSKTVDFTDITLPSGLQIMVAQGQQGTATALWTAITDSTVIVLLGFMLVAVVVASVVIWLLERGSNPEFAGKASDGVAEGTWWATVTMLTVGYGDRVPRTRGGRSFSILWMVFGMLIVAAVTATFTANLTVSRLNTPISSVDDLRDHSVVTVKDSVAAEALQARHINAQQVATTGEMVAAVRSGKVEAAVFDSPVLARAVHESSGNLALAGPPFTHSFDAFAVGPGSHLRTEVNGALLELLEDGSYDQIYRSWFAG